VVADGAHRAARGGAGHHSGEVSTPLFSGETFEEGFPLITLAAVVASILGVLIVTRYPSTASAGCSCSVSWGR
jgi:hypothetical protein